MSKTIHLLLIFCFFSNVAFAQKVKKLFLKRFPYTVSILSRYEHDGDLNVDYFVIRNSTKPNKQNSAIALATRNDTIFMKGSYFVYKDTIVFKRYYYHQYREGKHSSDSSKTVFSPDKAGHLILRKTIYYKKGKPTEYKY